jgi:hypothetical protein
MVAGGAKYAHRLESTAILEVSGFGGPGPNAAPKRYFPQRKTELIMARGLLLWLLGVPLSVIILIALFTNFI